MTGWAKLLGASRASCVLVSVLAAAPAATIALQGLATPLPIVANDGATEDQHADVRVLDRGTVIERELGGGQAHAYDLTLASGQYVHLVVDQRGVDVVLNVSAPDGGQLAEIDSHTGAHGLEMLSLVVEATGRYRLDVRSVEETAAAGRYVVRMEALRPATPQDGTRTAAQAALSEGLRLHFVQATAESRRRAIEKLDEALALWRVVGEPHREAVTLIGLGSVHVSLGNTRQALELYEQALLLNRSSDDRRGEAVTLGEIGLAYNYLGDRRKALDYYTETLSLRRAMQDRQGEAVALNGIGAIYHALGDTQQALDCLRDALSLRRVVGDRRGEAVTLNNMATVYGTLGDIPQALDYHRQALTLRRATQDRQGEAVTLNNMALAHGDLGEPQLALEHHGKALALRRSVGDRRGEATTLSNIGQVYISLGEPQQAIGYLNDALTLRRAVDDRRGEAVTLNNLGLAYGELGDETRALDYFTKALPLRRATGDRVGEATTLINIGGVLERIGKKRDGLEHYRQAVPLLQAAGDRRRQAVTLNNMGKVYIDLKELDAAFEYLSQALPMRRAVGDRAGEATTLFNIARLERDRGNLLEARSRVDDALQIRESLRARVDSRQLRTSYAASAHDFFELAVDVSMRLHAQHPSQGHDASALLTSERARARTLLESLAEARADIREGIDPALLLRERAVQQQLNAAADRLMGLSGSGDDRPLVAATRRRIETLQTAYQEVQAEIRRTSPRYAALTQPVPFDLAEIQRHVLDESTVLLEYALGEPRSYLWAVTTTSLDSFVLPGRSAIESLARQVYELLTARNRRVKFETREERAARVARADADYPERAAALSRMVLEPVRALLGGKRLLIVSDGALQYVPLAALPVPGHTATTRPSGRLATRRPAPPLAIEHEIVSVPSASTLAALRRELAGRAPAPKAVAVLADPVFDSNDGRVRHPAGAHPIADANRTGARARRAADESDSPPAAGATVPLGPLVLERAIRQSGIADDRRSVPRLPFTRREARAILALVPMVDRKAALDFAASRATATSGELGQYRIVHFATHGVLDSEHPDLSGLVLSLVDPEGREQEGFLRAHEIFNLRLPAELIVLSGCRTGLGKEIKGEGLVGLTRGFMYAGAARVLVSLWDVHDQATAELMTRFYGGMLGPKRLSAAAALREAQAAMREQARWRSPYYWAGFVLQGEPR